jgi:hypothetical protein
LIPAALQSAGLDRMRGRAVSDMVECEVSDTDGAGLERHVAAANSRVAETIERYRAPGLDRTAESRAGHAAGDENMLVGFGALGLWSTDLMIDQCIRLIVSKWSRFRSTR